MANNYLRPGEEELYMVLYADQVYEEGKDESNEGVVIDTGFDKDFGCITAFDWPIYDGPDTSKLEPVARAQGQHIQSDKVKGGHWFHTGNILFGETSRHSGSTIVFTGIRRKTSRHGQWAIVGGTRHFTFAQGVIYYKAKKNKNNEVENIQLDIRVLYRPVKSSELRHVFSEFSPSEIDGAMKRKKHVGEGGFGNVYKAYIRDTTVAIKILKHEGLKAHKDLENEIQSFRNIRHKNLVTLLGACIDKRALIYEFCPKGTLGDRLFPNSSSDREPLSWKETVQIARSICSGLKFLHDKRIAHRDLKPNNILFDAQDVCKICDYGISRFLDCTSETSETPVRYTALMGTPDYWDPDPKCRGKNGKLTRKSDVYSLGIILLQLVTGKDPHELRKWVVQEYKQGRVKDLLDTSNPRESIEMLELGLECSLDTGDKRPDMATVCLKIESMGKSNKIKGASN